MNWVKQKLNWVKNKIKRFWKWLLVGGVGIVMAATLIPQDSILTIQNRADAIDQEIKSKYTNAVEIIDKRTLTGKTYNLGEGRYLLKSTIGRLHYQDSQGQFQNIDITKRASDLAGFESVVDTAPYKLYISDKGDRRIYPDRNKPEYIDLPTPDWLNGKKGTWVSDRELKWTNPNYDVSLILREDRIKFLAVIKKPISQTSFSFNVSENGAQLFNYLGGLTYWDSSEVPVIRDLGMTYENGTLTLSWDFSGMVYPIYVVPTFAPTAGTDDVMRWGATEFRTTDASIHIGLIGGTSYSSEIRFPSVNIPQGSTINSAYITFICGFSGSSNTVSSTVYLEDADDSDIIDDYSEFDAAALTAGTAWNSIPGWTVGNPYDTPDFTADVQTVINRAGWVSNNAFGVFIKDAGSTAARFYAAYNNTTYTEPVLTVTWTEPGGVVNLPVIIIEEE